MNIGRYTAQIGAIAVAAAWAIFLGGCSGSQRMSDLVEANRVLTDRNQQLLSDNQGLQSANGALQGRLDATNTALNEQLSINDELKRQLEAAGVSLDELGARISAMKFGPLDASTSEALTELANQYPDLIEFDARLGMLRFKSDLTFASGSDAVSAEARAGLTRLAEILNSTTASAYDVKVLGHTDSQRLSPGTKEKFRSNLMLSAFRAAAVRNVLTDLGVAAERFEIAGRGEFDPVVPNVGNGNTPQNRRVEIYLTRNTRRGIAVGATPEAGGNNAVPSTKPANKEDFMK